MIPVSGNTIDVISVSNATLGKRAANCEDCGDKPSRFADQATFSAEGLAALEAEEQGAGAGPVAGEETASAGDDRSEAAANSDRTDQTTADEEEAAAPNEPTGVDGEPLDQAELQTVRQLEQRDREVRIHEQAHIAAAGGHNQGGPRYSYQTGPDGGRYAVGGEVSIDTSEAHTPEATIRKMATVRRAALAPAEPSAADRAIANAATQKMNVAQLELMQQRMAGAEEDGAIAGAAERMIGGEASGSSGSGPDQDNGNPRQPQPILP